MKLFSLVAFVMIALVLTYIICKPKSIKQKLTGSWFCIQSDAGYESKSFQLLFYKDDSFYWHMKGRVPTPWARGKFTLTDTSKITFTFSDTNEEAVFIIKKIEPKLIEVDYNGHLVTFRRIDAIKTLP